MPPLPSVDWAKFMLSTHLLLTLGVCSVRNDVRAAPLIPNVISPVDQPFLVRLSPDEELQFRRNEPKRYFLGGQQGETLHHIVLEVNPRHNQGTHSGSTLLFNTFAEHSLDNCQILSHAALQHSRGVYRFLPGGCSATCVRLSMRSAFTIAGCRWDK